MWEAHVVRGHGPFDFWILEWEVLVEVDGEQHVSRGRQGTSVEQQTNRDRQKEEAAVRMGFHVVQLHCEDVGTYGYAWRDVLIRALTAASAGQPATVHYTPAYPRTS